MGAVGAAQRLAGLEREVVAQRDEGVLQRDARAGVGVDVAGRDAAQAEARARARRARVAGAVAGEEGALQLDAQALGAEGLAQQRGAGLVVDAVLAQPLRQTSPSACSQTASSETAGGIGSRGRSRVRAWASVSRRQRLRQPRSLATSSVRWRPSSRVSSAPWIGRRPSPRAAWANSIEPQTPSWSVSASVS